MSKSRESVFPDSLMIRDVGIYDDLGGAGQRIYTTAGQGYEKQKYIRADKVREMLKDHAEKCGEAAQQVRDANPWAGRQEYVDACRTARIEEKYDDDGRVGMPMSYSPSKHAADVEKILTRAVEWWLLEGSESFSGAPAWVFSARQLEELKDQVKKSPHDEG